MTQERGNEASALLTCSSSINTDHINIFTGGDNSNCVVQNYMCSITPAEWASGPLKSSFLFASSLQSNYRNPPLTQSNTTLFAAATPTDFHKPFIIFIVFTHLSYIFIVTFQRLQWLVHLSASYEELPLASLHDHFMIHQQLKEKLGKSWNRLYRSHKTIFYSKD